MANIKTCLEAAGSSLDKVVLRRSYFLNIKKDVPIVARIWDKWAPGVKPVSTAVQVSGLAKEGAVIEIEVEAEV
ncbi:hypothetical protein PRZ48_009096 [Zasmidium cellare]|uniref:Uncharacterized protein n=1 Tax=Zasmidium cellare TaxID=395010 RepID=A0ABR0EHE6_ZASCE|nr:hypothetical protein PRZ48_009096 [Zasmidium cellare]